MGDYITISITIKEEDYYLIRDWCNTNDIGVSNLLRREAKKYILNEVNI